MPKRRVSRLQPTNMAAMRLLVSLLLMALKPEVIVQLHQGNTTEWNRQTRKVMMTQFLVVVLYFQALHTRKLPEIFCLFVYFYFLDIMRERTFKFPLGDQVEPKVSMYQN